MEKWLRAALDYIPRWIEHQMRFTEQPGCVIALARRDSVVFEAALGHANQPRGVALTPRHRFRVASHSKTFTAAGILKLREQGRLRLDDAIGQFLTGLHPQVARATLAQLMSHSAGLVRDGADASQWAQRRPFLDAAALRADLENGPSIEANTRFKYSNHGYGLAGLAIEAVTGERYGDWIAREIVAESGLRETTPDGPVARDIPLADGHSARLPLGRRVAVPVGESTHALASATGFVSTAADLARFFASLAPDAKKSVLSVPSRREMARRQWRDPHSSIERWYGLGTISATVGEWEVFGHSGGFPGTITRTVCVPSRQLTLSVLTNAADGLAHSWLDGALHILQAFERQGGPSRRTSAWQGRWWGLWGAVDLLPMGNKVMVGNPGLAQPLLDASEIQPGRRDRAGVLHGEITLAGGFVNHGEAARIEHDGRGRAKAFWFGGTRLLPEAQVAKELERRYGGSARKR